jgi:hypothetical protein
LQDLGGDLGTTERTIDVGEREVGAGVPIGEIADHELEGPPRLFEAARGAVELGEIAVAGEAVRLADDALEQGPLGGRKIADAKEKLTETAVLDRRRVFLGGDQLGLRRRGCRPVLQIVGELNARGKSEQVARGAFEDASKK